MKRGVQQEGRRKQWIRGIAVAGLLITLGVIFLAYRLQRTNKPDALSQPPPLPKNVDQQLSGLTFTRSEGGRHIFTIHASRTLAFKQSGSTLLDNVYVEFFGRSGKRYDILRTAQGDYNTATGDLSTPGEVQLILNATPQQSPDLAEGSGNREENGHAGTNSAQQSVFVNTSKVFSRNHGTLLESNTPVRFHLGAVSGSGYGLVYGTNKGQIILKQDVNAVFHPTGARNETPIQLSASRLEYDDAGKQAQLSGPVKIVQGSRTITARQGSILLDADNRVTTILMEGEVNSSDQTPKNQLRLTADRLQGMIDPQSNQLRKLVSEGHVHGMSSQPGTVASFDAQMAELNFLENAQTPASGNATGQVLLTVARSGAPAKRPSQTGQFGGEASHEELLTEAVQFTFRPGEKTLKEAHTLAPGKLILYPESSKAGLRTVTADRFLMSFNSNNRFDTLHGQGGTRIVFSPAPDAPKQSPSETSARQLVAVFDPATGALQSVKQTGDFHFRNADLQATAEEAHNSASKQTVVLLGHPEVWDSTTRTRATRIILHLDSDTAEGLGHVQAAHIDPQQDSALPTNVLADSVVANRQTQIVHYEGQVRAWHGTDVIESASLILNQKLRQVSSNSRVTTSHAQPDSKPATPRAHGNEDGSGPLIIQADQLEYLDEGRKARYMGNVELNTENTKLRADRLDVYLSANKQLQGSEVERAVADGHVRVTQPSRYADGNHAVYDARSGEIVMTGGPPALYDAEKGLTSGQRLTFYIHDDRLQVDGGVNSPTVSKHRVAQ